MIERIPVDMDSDAGRARWLEFRRRDITASVVGALFDAHPYQTALGLYAEKNGVEMPAPDNDVLRRGRILETAVAAAVAEQRPGWRIIKATEYLRDPDLRLGATPDFYVEGDPRGLGVLQAKTVAPKEFAKHWADGVPPMWIMLQNATELLLEYEATWGAVAALVVDPYRLECPIFDVPKHAGVEKKITDAVRKFWADIETGQEPQPDYGRDGVLVERLYPDELPGRLDDWTGENMMPVLLAEHAEIADRMKADAARRDEIETEIKFKLGEAAGATLGGDWRITFRTQHRSAFSVPAKSFRVLRISDHRPKGKDNDDDGRPF